MEKRATLTTLLTLSLACTPPVFATSSNLIDVVPGFVKPTPRTEVQKFNERYGIWFIFESTCSFCMALAPILHEFADSNNIIVRGISKDGKPIPTWAGAWQPDRNGALYRLGVEEMGTPVLILRDSATQENLPIGQGLMTAKQLSDRIYTLTQIRLED